MAQPTLAQLVKAKYPGVYDSLSDAELESKVKAKYPGVYDAVPTTQTQADTPPPDTRSGLTKNLDAALGAPGATETLSGLASGAAKGAANTVAGLGEMLHRVPGVSALVDRLYGTPGLSKAAFPAAREAVKPSTPAEKAGYTAEQVGEFLVPGPGKAGKVAEAVRSGVTTFAQTGSPTAAAAATGATAAVNAAVPAIKAGANWTAERIERALVKATAADKADGFTASNVFKHDVGGTLQQTYQKTTDKIKDLSAQLGQRLRYLSPGGQKPEIDVIDALDRAAQKATGDAAHTMGQNTAMADAVTKVLHELAPVLDQAGTQAATSGKIDLVTANALKQGVGELGAWKHDPTGRVVSADDKAMETVANAFYQELKNQIEQKAVGPVKSINKQIGELIGIKNAVIRRIPVAERSNVLNAGDLVGFGTGKWGLALANHLLQSGRTANVLSAIGQSATSAVPGRAAGAAVSGIEGASQ